MYRIDKKLGDNNIEITSKDFGPGYWINPLNGEWINKRIYIKSSNPNDEDYPSKSLIKMVKKLNKKLLKSNKQILILKRV